MDDVYNSFISKRAEALAVFLNDWVADQINNFNYDHNYNNKVSWLELKTVQLERSNGLEEYVLEFCVSCSMAEDVFCKTCNFYIQVSKDILTNSGSLTRLNTQLIHSIVRSRVQNLDIKDIFQDLLTTVLTAYLLHMQQVKRGETTEVAFTRFKFEHIH